MRSSDGAELTMAKGYVGVGNAFGGKVVDYDMDEGYVCLGYKGMLKSERRGRVPLVQ